MISLRGETFKRVLVRGFKKGGMISEGVDNTY